MQSLAIIGWISNMESQKHRILPWNPKAPNSNMESQSTTTTNMHYINQISLWIGCVSFTDVGYSTCTATVASALLPLLVYVFCFEVLVNFYYCVYQYKIHETIMKLSKINQFCLSETFNFLCNINNKYQKYSLTCNCDLRKIHVIRWRILLNVGSYFVEWIKKKLMSPHIK